MVINLPQAIHKLLATSKFWQDNYLILREFKPFRTKVIQAILFTLIAAVLEATGVGLIASLLQGLTNPNQPPIHTGLEWFDIWFLGVQASATVRIYKISGLILFTVWMRAIFAYLGKYLAKTCEIKLVDALRRRIFEQFQRFNLSYYSQNRGAELINTFSLEVGNINQAFNEIINFVTKSCVIIAYALVMLLISWQLTFATVLAFSLLAAAVSNLIRWVREASFEMTSTGADMAAIATEYINGVKTVQASWSQEFEGKRFDKASQMFAKAYMQSNRIGSSVLPLAEATATTILIGIIIFAVSTLVSDGSLHIISLLAFLFALFRLLPILAHMNSSWGTIATFAGSLRVVHELLRTDNKTYIRDGEVEFTRLKQGISFENVDFAYDSNNTILEEINLTIEQGKTIAIVGASGSGKTTLADLLIRFYEPTVGNIFVDGVNLNQYKLCTWRQKIAVVSQDTFIFNTSVRENIAYGLEGVSNAAIAEVARQANALEFILEMPEGLETKLGDRGVRLSGGQKQRIAIARALLRNPDILILDEATSALDSISERLVQESLEKLVSGRTVIAIAHRLSTIYKADKVIVLESGKIVEQGSYQELLQQRGKLWKYHQMQHEIGVNS
ncbi:heterocyst formation ABC transporter subunit HepA [Calothrix sp. UHCC 0171]|uniref:heterocyst formation ABC transporter subunit HepA n=1 Tax=Calothrix sp. UHCC 0171 TaxID=3110245 RepID=UPI002B1F236B|nr:heterocyst formation ABC transporter subunit HepA [Calothrix sp. UHCC 0171]MEA5573373.1 heterocyst formation ABC transporter subunit HepA [Calothrix sp. UHCC 0171]